jgi:hypothetical protein
MAKQIDFSKPLTDDEAEYVAQRPWMLRDAELEGHEIRLESEEEEEDERPYTDWTFPELVAEIARRNASRDDDDKVVPAAKSSARYAAALTADDEAHAEEDDEEEDDESDESEDADQ